MVVMSTQTKCLLRDIDRINRLITELETGESCHILASLNAILTRNPLELSLQGILSCSIRRGKTTRGAISSDRCEEEFLDWVPHVGNSCCFCLLGGSFFGSSLLSSGLLSCGLFSCSLLGSSLLGGSLLGSSLLSCGFFSGSLFSGSFLSCSLLSGGLLSGGLLSGGLLGGGLLCCSLLCCGLF